MQSQRACFAKSGDNRQKTTMRKQRRFKVTILNSKKLAEKEDFVISKKRGSQSPFNKCCLRAARFQKCTFVCWGQRIRKRKSSQKAVFSQKLLSDNPTERFLAQPRGHMVTQERLRDNSRHTIEKVFPVMRVVVNYRKGQKQLKKNCSKPKKCLSQTTYLRPSVTQRTLNCFTRQSN